MSTLRVMDAVGGIRHMSMGGDGTEANPFYALQSNGVADYQSHVFFNNMDTVGDGSGSNNMAVNGSVTPVRFMIKPAPGEVIQLSRLIWYVEDTGSFDADKWGNGIVMANGITIETVHHDTTHVYPTEIKSTGDLAGICYDVNVQQWGTGNEVMAARWTFTKAGAYIRLDGDNNESMSIVINDDLTGLVAQRVNAQGFVEIEAS